MHKNLLFLIGLLSQILLGCSPATPPNSTQATPPTPAPAQELPKEKPMAQTDTLVEYEPLSANPSQSYAYYLPKEYSHDRPWRLAIFLDAHAKGAEPLALYQSLASEFGFVLVGSNTSENGQIIGTSLAIYDNLIADLTAKFNIDKAHVTVAGFSGGARVAAALAQQRTGIQQVIGCGAGFQPRQGDTFGYFGMAGLEDFNYWEMYDLERALQGQAQPAAFSFFAGGHAWPPAAVMRAAFEFSYYRLGEAGSTMDSLVAFRIQRFGEDLKKMDAKDALGQARLYAGLLNAVQPRTMLGKKQQAYQDLLNSKGFADALAAQESSRAIELKLRQDYVNQLGSKSIGDWQKMAADLRAGKVSHPGADHFTDLRILNFLSLNTYFQVDGAMKAGDKAAADHFLQLYAIIDPNNAEHAYLRAVLNMRESKTEAAISSLQQAIRLGFKDAKRMRNEAAFASLADNQQFKSLLLQIEPSVSKP